MLRLDPEPGVAQRWAKMRFASSSVSFEPMSYQMPGTGQVWTGQQSLPLGLIDKVGGYRVALLETARDVGISGEPSVVRPAKAKRGLLALLADDGEDLFPNPSQLLNQAPGFYFMWK